LPNLKKIGRDPWKIFTIFTIVLFSLLIICSQIWILKSSFKTDGGSFTVKSDAVNGSLLPENETIERLKVNSDDSGKIITIEETSSKQSYTATTVSPGAFALSMGQKEAKVSTLSHDELKVESGGHALWISQKVFSNPFAGQSNATVPMAAEVSGNKVVISYTPGAFISFVDKHTHATWENYRTFLGRSDYADAIKNSFIIMVLSTLFASIFGVGLAYLFARYRIPGTSMVITIITMASVAPPFLGAYAWRMLLGRTGIITRALHLDWTIVGLHGIIWVITWLVFPIIFLLTYDAFTSVDHSMREASMSLGGGLRRTFWKVELPLAVPGIVNGLYLAMMTAFTDFGTPYIISIHLDVLPVLIYKQYMSEVGGNLSLASTGSMLMVLFSSVLLMAERIYLARRSYASVKTHQPSVRAAGRQRIFFTYLLTGIVLLFAFTPHVTVAISAFVKWKSGIPTSEWTLGNFTRLFHTNLYSIGVTLLTGLSATLLDFIFGIGIAYVVVKKRYPFFSNALNQLVMIPYIIPGTVLGIGFILLFNQKPLLLTGTWVILMLAYFIRKLPYAVKSAESSLYQVHPALGEAAESLGAKPLRSFREITFPLMLSGVVSGMTLAFLQIMTEISATIILYRPPWKPMTAVIFENTIDAGADFGVASSMTVLLMIMLYVPLYIITVKARRPKEARIESI
jgi:iron(III) transport system permease protein